MLSTIESPFARTLFYSSLTRLLLFCETDLQPFNSPAIICQGQCFLRFLSNCMSCCHCWRTQLHNIQDLLAFIGKNRILSTSAIWMRREIQYYLLSIESSFPRTLFYRSLTRLLLASKNSSKNTYSYAQTMTQFPFFLSGQETSRWRCPEGTCFNPFFTQSFVPQHFPVVMWSPAKLPMVNQWE